MSDVNHRDLEFDDFERSLLWLPDWQDEYAACTNAATSEDVPSIEEMLLIMESFPKPPEHDRIVTTELIWGKMQLLAKPELLPASAYRRMSMELDCLKIEVHSCDATAVTRAMDLQKEGGCPLLVIGDEAGSLNRTP